jgi:hypothetical protein
MGGIPEETLRNLTEELTTPPWGTLGRDVVLGSVSGVRRCLPARSHPMNTAERTWLQLLASKVHEG